MKMISSSSPHNFPEIWPQIQAATKSYRHHQSWNSESDGAAEGSCWRDLIITWTCRVCDAQSQRLQRHMNHVIEPGSFRPGTDNRSGWDLDTGGRGRVDPQPLPCCTSIHVAAGQRSDVRPRCSTNQLYLQSSSRTGSRSRCCTSMFSCLVC